MSWRPSSYHYSLLGTHLLFEFSIAKLLDHKAQSAQLESSPNPFAVVVVCHLQALATRNSPLARLQWKLRLVKGLYQRNFDRQDILELFRLIDWLLALPDDLEDRFEQELIAFEEENLMPYVTSIERRGEQRGIERNKREMALRMLQRNLPIEQIAEFTDLSVDQIQALQADSTQQK